jgi:tRNA dimethylallyltransferase
MTDDSSPVCFAITGPTACGKTDVALALAREFPIEIVSMDSAMVFRGMDIGTAKPDLSIRSEISHHLIDVLDPEESFSAGRFATETRRLAGEIAERGKLALIAGGTMLYLKALREGLADLPERDPSVRADIDARAGVVGWPALHAELAQLDPISAARIEPTDRQRIQRALEVHAITGVPLSRLQRSAAQEGLRLESVALVPPDRAGLHQAIEQRFDRMVGDGLIDEVERLRARPGLKASHTSMRAVGYRQVWTFLEGRCDWDEARSRAIAATRQLAKRQLTWLRGDASSAQLTAGDSALLQELRRRIEPLVRGLTSG